jgi:6-pyruvoyltetrahydropterin/6-carboxytetrahydropterin synthase
MFELKIEDHFAAAHNLRGYQGACEALHGHNWKVEAVVRTTKLNDIGLAIDFKDVKVALNEILDELDHKYLNDLKAFSLENPSSENIARFIFLELAEKLKPFGVSVYKVTAWESEKACASYLEG